MKRFFEELYTSMGQEEMTDYVWENWGYVVDNLYDGAPAAMDEVTDVALRCIENGNKEVYDEYVKELLENEEVTDEDIPDAEEY